MIGCRVTVEIEIHKEPSNEADPWEPPSAREVAAFVQSRISHVETDDGWFAGSVLAVSEERIRYQRKGQS